MDAVNGSAIDSRESRVSRDPRGGVCFRPIHREFLGCAIFLRKAKGMLVVNNLVAASNDLGICPTMLNSRPI